MSEEKNKAAKLYDTFRGQIQHEDVLFNQRLTWLVAVQAFLFVPYFNLCNLNSERSILQPDQRDLALTALSVLGLSCCVFIAMSCWAAHGQIGHLTKEYLAKRAELERYIKSDYLPRMLSDKTIRLLGIAAPVLTITAFSLVWCVLICSRIGLIGLFSVIPFLVVVTISFCMVTSVAKEQWPTNDEVKRQLYIVASAIALVALLACSVTVVLFLICADSLPLLFLGIMAFYGLLVFLERRLKHFTQGNEVLNNGNGRDDQ